MSDIVHVDNPEVIVEYGVTPEQIEAKKAAYSALSCDTSKGYEEVRLAIADCRATRVAVEKRRKELKADALEYGRKVDSVAKTLTTMVEQIEEPLQAKKDAVDAEKARAKAEREAAEKAALEAKVKAEREAEEARLRAEREAEEKRLAEIAAAQKAEADRLAAERRAFEEAQRLAKEAADKAAAEAEAKLAAERAKLEADRRAEEARQRVAREQEEARLASVRAEEERRLAEVRAEEERRAAAARAEREAEERKAAEARAVEEKRLAEERAALEAQRQETERLERERLARIETERKAELARVAAEEARVKEAERQAALAARLEALRPDTEKLAAFAHQIRSLVAPQVTDLEAVEIAAGTMAALREVATELDELVRGMGGSPIETPIAAAPAAVRPTLVLALEEDSDSDWAHITGTLNGKELFSGSYGGEPEDNSRNRDYSWVEGAIESVAEAGGIAVEYVQASSSEAAE